MVGDGYSDDEDGPITFTRPKAVVSPSKPSMKTGTGHPSSSQSQPKSAARAVSAGISQPSLKPAALSQSGQGAADISKGSVSRPELSQAGKAVKPGGSGKNSAAGEPGSKAVAPGQPDVLKQKVKSATGTPIQKRQDGGNVKADVRNVKEEAVNNDGKSSMVHGRAKGGLESNAASAKDMHRGQPNKVPPSNKTLMQQGARKESSFSDDDKPLAQRAQVPSSVVTKKRSADSKAVREAVKKQKVSVSSESSSDDSESDSEDDRPPAKVRVPKPKPSKVVKKVASKEKKKEPPSKKRKRAEKNAGGSKKGDKASGNGDIKWKTLEHAGVIFPPEYTPHGVKMLYDDKPVTLTPAQEEVATMFAVMKDTDYAQKTKFCQNFWADWKKVLGPGHVIKDLNKCDFGPIYQWHQVEKEKKKSMSSEEKKRLKEDKVKAEDKYMWAVVDGVKEKVGNFRVEPPGLFRGRGEHPKMGKLKRRIQPEDVVINIGREAKVPPCPIAGHRWKEVKHDQTVTWLAYWKDPISTSDFKYVFLAPSSSLKGESDREKYEKARRLKEYIDKIRINYTRDFDSKDALRRQTAVATYLIDRLALRAGNEKGEDEADTVGCCSLKVENVKCIPPSSLEFDFLGKDSIRYFNTVEVEPKVYKAIADFSKGKTPEKNLFDQLDTSKLNKVLADIMPGLTAKVFRTYNASITLDRLLQSTAGSIIVEKAAEYNRANKEVAILCNHQKSVSKNHGVQIEKLTEKMESLKSELEELEEDLKRAKQKKPPLKRGDGTPKKILSVESLEKKVKEKQLQVKKKELEMSNREEMKTVALGTSKINYMDPRITVAWCKKHEVPIEKMFNKSLLAKFAWAMDVEPDYRF